MALDHAMFIVVNTTFMALDHHVSSWRSTMHLHGARPCVFMALDHHASSWRSTTMRLHGARPPCIVMALDHHASSWRSTMPECPTKWRTLSKWETT